MSQNNEHAGGEMPLFSQELGDWALFALDTAIEFFTDGDSTPFLMVQDEEEKRHLLNLDQAAQAGIEPVLQAARSQILQLFPTVVFYALVWDAELNIEGENHNGILAECGQLGEEDAWLFTQLYEGDVAQDTFDAKEEPIVISQVASALGEER